MSIYRNTLGVGIIFSDDNGIPGVMSNSHYNGNQSVRWMVMATFLQTRVDTLLPTLFLREPYSSAYEIEQNGLADRIRCREPELLASIPGSLSEGGLCVLVKTVLTAVTDRMIERNMNATDGLYLHHGIFRPKRSVSRLPSLLKRRVQRSGNDHLTYTEKYSAIWSQPVSQR